MQILTTIAALREIRSEWRRAGQRVALVPTMGNLHEGHVELLRQAREHAQRVIVSVFVNPLQFGRNEDFDRYPRTPDADAERLRAAGADLLFMPGTSEVYPHGFVMQTRIEVPGISEILCGAVRPGHFSGVATVVNLLFNMVQPDVALFGEKDYQQLLVIRNMACDLHVPVEIIGVPTVRNAGGLALSSRNQYLTEAERAQATTIYRCLRETTDALRAGGRDFVALQQRAIEVLRAAGFRPDYFEVRRPDLGLPSAGDSTFVVLVAAWVGKARLLDNLSVSV